MTANPAPIGRCLLFCTMAILLPQVGLAKPGTQPDDEQLQELVGALRSNNHEQRQAAIKKLVDIGAPAVPALLRISLDEPHGQGTFDAECALRLMGDKARSALPRLIALAESRPTSQPAGGKNAPSPRIKALILLQGMGWAADELIPVLQKISEDEKEEDRIRMTALSDLGYMGKNAIPILRRHADGPETPLRENARSLLAMLLDKQGIQTRGDYYASLIEADPFSPKVPEYLAHTKGEVNSGRTHALTERIKTAYRARLKEKPDAELALALAKMIQNQLAATDLKWSAPADSGSSTRPREDPRENYTTLAEALSLGFAHADKSSELRKTLGVGLAKLRLLQGDWEGMNQVLTQLEWPAIAAERRRMLAAPPVNWTSELSTQWTASDEKMRSGDCGLVFRVEKDGKGVRGVHVLLKQWTPPGNTFVSGIRADTLFLAPAPLPLWGGHSFGYGGERGMTRYAVSDESGTVLFEKLPKMEIQFELLVPTSSFTESRRGWDLWMEVSPGEMKRATVYGGEGGVDWNKPPAVVTLEPGKTVRYPRLVVLPQIELDLDDWSKVDPDQLEIAWSPLRAQPDEAITYELEMILTGPSQANRLADFIPAIETTRESLKATRWPVGAKGVGGRRLKPGNIYAFGVVARDAKGGLLGRSPKKCVWVPWQYRSSDPPVTGSDTFKQSPIQVETWYLGSYSYGDGRSETLDEKVSRQIRENPAAFEREYIQLGRAWLDWHAKQREAAESQLNQLAKELPEGSVPRETALWLLGQMKEGKGPQKRLKLVGAAGGSTAAQ